MSEPVDDAAARTVEPERYYTKSWLITATVLMGLVSSGLGASLLVTAESETPLFTAVGALGLATGLLTFYVAWWSKRTPLAVIWPDRLELNVAVFRARRTIPWSELSGLEDMKNGSGRLTSRAGPVEIPFMALEKSDATKLRKTIARLVRPALQSANVKVSG